MAAGTPGKTVAMIAKQNYEALLMDYAAGALNEAQSLVVAAHLTLSPDARRIVSDCEAIGGGLLHCACEPVAMKKDSLDKVLKKMEEGQCKGKDKCAPSCCDTIKSLNLPLPVQEYLQKAERIVWKTVYPGIHSYEIDTACRQSKIRLVQIDPGVKTPEHSHGGIEITLLIDGAVHDRTGTYSRGDLLVLDQTVTHQPIADEKRGCVCLIVNSNPIHLTGWLGKFLNPFLTR